MCRHWYDKRVPLAICSLQPCVYLVKETRDRVAHMLANDPDADECMVDLFRKLKPMTIERLENWLTKIEPNFDAFDLKQARFEQWTKEGDWKIQGMRHRESRRGFGIQTSVNLRTRMFTQAISINATTAFVIGGTANTRMIDGEERRLELL